MTNRLASDSASDAEPIRSRREHDWRNGVLLITVITALPIVVVALVHAFQG